MKATGSLTEVMILMHFAAPLNLTVLDFASWAAAFEEFDLPQQTPAALPLDQNGNVQADFLIGLPALPRLVLRSSERPYILQLQTDRFGISWARKDEIGVIVNYPGFEDLLLQLKAAFDKFQSWYKERFGSNAPLGLLELGYFNSLPPEKEGGEKRRLSELFRFVQPGSRSLSSFQAIWSELLQPGDNLPRVTVQTGVGLAMQHLQPTPVPVIFFNFSGLGRLDASSAAISSSIDSVANLLHNRILETYKSAIFTE